MSSLGNEVKFPLSRAISFILFQVKPFVINVVYFDQPKRQGSVNFRANILRKASSHKKILANFQTQNSIGLLS